MTQNNGNPMGAIMNLIMQGGNNPQAFANSLLQKNPDFAKALQGQNPRTLAMQELQKRGIDPNAVMRLFGGNGNGRR